MNVICPFSLKHESGSYIHRREICSRRIQSRVCLCRRQRKGITSTEQPAAFCADAGTAEPTAHRNSQVSREAVKARILELSPQELTSVCQHQDWKSECK